MTHVAIIRPFLLFAILAALQSTLLVAQGSPVLSSLSPTSTLGPAPITLTVNGSGFVQGALVFWNGSGINTTFVSSTQLRAAVPYYVLTTAGNATITVTIPSGAAPSNPLTFLVVLNPPVSVAGVVPDHVDAGGPAIAITVTGANFLQGATVNWNSTPLATTFVNSMQLNASVPASLTALTNLALLSVKSPDTTESGALFFKVLPTLTAITPPASMGGATLLNITLNGGGFTRNCGFDIATSGYKDDFSTTYVSSTTLLGVLNGNILSNPGWFSISVFDSSTGLSSRPVSFQVSIPPPVITSLSPSSVTTGGPDFILVVNGTGIFTGSQIVWNGTGLNTLYFGSGTLSAVVPASLTAAPGLVNVTVTAANGFQSPPVAFRIVAATPPSLTSFTPTSVDAGGQAFAIIASGTKFVKASTLMWGSTALLTSLMDNGQLSSIVPPNLTSLSASVNLSVKNPDGTQSAATPFRVEPVLSAIHPATLTAGAGSTLSATGIGFVSSNYLSLTNAAGATFALATTINSSSELVVTVPASAVTSSGTYKVGVRDPSGTFSRLQTLTVATPLQITSLDPSSAAAGGAAFTLTLNGSGFTPATTVHWNTTLLSTTYTSSSQMLALVPASLIATAGTVSIVAQDPLTTGQAVGSFVVNGRPTVSSLVPPSATAGGQAFTLTVSGTGFRTSAYIQWNGWPLPTTLVNTTELTAPVAPSFIAAAGSAIVTVVNPDGATSNAATFAVSPDLPTTSAAGIVNAASNLPSIAPGSLISIYGSSLATGILPAPSLPLETTLGSTSVTINDVHAPLLYVGPGQINAQVPFDTNPGTVRLVVQSNGLQSTSVSFPVTATGPGVMTLPASNHALAVNVSDGNLNSSEHPVRSGEYFTAYATGQGLLDHPVESGAAAPSSPYSIPLAPVQVRIGGQAAEIQFAGLAPGFVGLLQLNVLVPTVAAGEQSLEVVIGGVHANPTVISVVGQ